MSDLISRQDAIDILDDFESDIELGERDSYKTHRGRLLSLPSADRPTGKWVEKDGECVCSECGNSVSFSRTKDGWVLGKFCQTCGAKMGGDSDG